MSFGVDRTGLYGVMLFGCVVDLRIQLLLRVQNLSRIFMVRFKKHLVHQSSTGVTFAEVIEYFSGVAAERR
jgi:hypothetical protein